MERCIDCRNENKPKISKEQKKKVVKEIKEFLKDPNNFYVYVHPDTLFYKFKRI